MSGYPQEAGQVLPGFCFRLGMDTAKEIHPASVQQTRDRFVRLHHEHLNDCVGEARIGRLGADDALPIVKNQLHLRQVEHEHPIAHPAISNDARQTLRLSKQLDHFRRGAAGLALQDQRGLLVTQPLR